MLLPQADSRSRAASTDNDPQVQHDKAVTETLPGADEVVKQAAAKKAEEDAAAKDSEVSGEAALAKANQQHEKAKTKQKRAQKELLEAQAVQEKVSVTLMCTT